MVTHIWDAAKILAIQCGAIKKMQSVVGVSLVEIFLTNLSWKKTCICQVSINSNKNTILLLNWNYLPLFSEFTLLNQSCRQWGLKYGPLVAVSQMETTNKRSWKVRK